MTSEVKPYDVRVTFRGGVDVADVYDGGVRICHLPGSTSVDSGRIRTKAYRLACVPVLEDALHRIAVGNGVYGQQAGEYKAIARAALRTAGIAFEEVRS